MVVAFVLTASGAILTILFYRRSAKRALGAALCLTACGVALLTSMFAWSSWDGTASSLGHVDMGGARLTVTGDARSSAYGASSKARLDLPREGAYELTLYWESVDAALAAGQTCVATSRPSLPDDGDRLREAHRNLSLGSLSVYRTEDVSWEPGLQSLIGPLRVEFAGRLDATSGEGGALVQGVVLGDRSKLFDSTTYDDFKTCGLAHLVAVSGSHLAVVAMLIAWACSLINCPRRLQTVIVVAVIVGYLFLSGLQASALRAAIMTVLGLSGGLLGRRKDSLSAIGAGVCLFLLTDPSAAFSLSLQLSVAAVTGIVLFSGYFTYALLSFFKHPSHHTRLKKYLIEPLALTLAAQIFTLPLTVSVFSTLPLISPLANLVVSPLISLLLATGLLAFLLAPVPLLGGAVLVLASSLGDVIAAIADLLAALPFASVPATAQMLPAFLASLVVFGLLHALWPDMTRRRCSILWGVGAGVCACLLVVALLPTSPRVIMLDVGQGDAMLVQDSAVNILIDTGPSDTDLLAALGRHHITHLDAVIVTHLHDDHYGALDALEGKVDVDEVVFSDVILEGIADHEAYDMAADLVGSEAVHGMSVGQSIGLPHITLRCVSPATLSDEGGNQDSLCFTITCDVDGDGAPEASMLTTGDAETPVVDGLVAGGGVGAVDVLKVGHHGSAAALDEEDLGILAPGAALISVGEGNDYGHPKPETLDLLSRFSTPVYRTDINGDITVSFTREGARIGVL